MSAVRADLLGKIGILEVPWLSTAAYVTDDSDGEQTMSILGKMAISTSRRIAVWHARLESRVVTVLGHNVAYFVGGRGDPVVLLHGLADDRYSFVECVADLTRHHRVILPDMPAHGNSIGDASDAGSIPTLVKWLGAFLDALGLGSVTLGGNSMGGHVALAFALSCGIRVDRLILVNPAGVGMSAEDIYTGFGTTLRGREDLDLLMRRVFWRPPRLPWFVADCMVRDINRGMPLHNEIARRLRGESGTRLDQQLAGIRAPTLTIWGQHDAVLARSVLEALRCIPDNRVMELQAGHSPQLEVPRAVATELSAFLHP